MMDFFRRYKLGLIYLATFVAAYLVFLVATIPAALVVPSFTKTLPVKLTGLGGTVWTGSATQVNLGKLQWQGANWRIHPWSLLLTKLAMTTSLGDQNNNFRGKVTISRSGRLSLEEAYLSMPLENLQALSYGMPVAYQGRLDAYLPLVIFERNQLFVVDGRVTLGGIKLTAPQLIELGNIKVEFKANNEGESVGQVSSVDGPVRIEGQIQLKRSAEVLVNLQLAARETGSDIDKALMLLGKRDPSGRVAFNYRYQIK